MNYINLISILFSLTTSFIAQNVEARLDSESIVGGDYAAEGQFKYQVSIQVHNIHLCGGGILADQYILTAAHCIINEKGEFKQYHLEVLAGALESNTTDNSAVRVKVAKAYVHREYDPINPDPNRPYYITGDIAVLKLKTGLGLCDNAKLSALRLPAKTCDHYPRYDGGKAIIAGYGNNWIVMDRNEENESIEVDSGLDHKLKFAETTVISEAKCSIMYRNATQDSHLCAAVNQRNPHNHEGICTGDSGGVLVHNGDTVIGVANSSPVGCREDQRAAVYTRVSSFISFIKNAMKDVKTDDMRVAEWRVKMLESNLSWSIIIVFSEN